MIFTKWSIPKRESFPLTTHMTNTIGDGARLGCGCLGMILALIGLAALVVLGLLVGGFIAVSAVPG